MGKPPQTSQPANVDIFVVRNRNAPIFQELPYESKIQETHDVNSLVFTASAKDFDIMVCGGKILIIPFCFSCWSLLYQ